MGVGEILDDAVGFLRTNQLNYERALERGDRPNFSGHRFDQIFEPIESRGAVGDVCVIECPLVVLGLSRVLRESRSPQKGAGNRIGFGVRSGDGKEGPQPGI